MATWRIDLHSINGAVVLSDLKVKNWMFNYQSNAPGAFEAECWISASGITEANLAPNRREIKIYRNSVLVWAGYLLAATVEPHLHTLRIRGEGYFSRLRRRLITSDLIYTDINIHQIMWNLIAHAQGKTNGNMGFTQGTHTGASIAVDREWCAVDTAVIAEGIDELTAMDDGSDWVITPTPVISADKEFRTYQPRRGTDLSGTISLSPSNTHTLSYEVDGSQVANWVQATGVDDCNPPDFIASDSTSQASYGLLELAEEVDSAKLRDVTAHAKETLRNFKDARWQGSAVYYEASGPGWGTFDVGDIIEIVGNRGFATFTKDVRVIGFEVQLDGPNVVFLQVEFDSVIA